VYFASLERAKKVVQDAFFVFEKKCETYALQFKNAEKLCVFVQSYPL